MGRAQGDTTAVWTGGTGSWSTAANWSVNAVPNNNTAPTSFIVEIDNNSPTLSAVTLNNSVAVDSVQITPGDSLNLSSGATLIAGNGNVWGMTNAGTITVNSGALLNLSAGVFSETTTGRLVVNGGLFTTTRNVQLTSNQSLELENGGTANLQLLDTNGQTMNVPTGTNLTVKTLNNGSGTLSVAGTCTIANGTSLGSNQSIQVLSGATLSIPVITVNSFGLVIPQGATLTNMSLLDNSGGGSVQVAGSVASLLSLNNSCGIFTANGSANVSIGSIYYAYASAVSNVNGTISLSGSANFTAVGGYVTGGNWNTSGSAQFNFSQGATLSGMTLNGTAHIDSVSLQGALTNNGTVLLSGSGMSTLARTGVSFLNQGTVEGWGSAAVSTSPQANPNFLNHGLIEANQNFNTTSDFLDLSAYTIINYTDGILRVDPNGYMYAGAGNFVSTGTVDIQSGGLLKLVSSNGSVGSISNAGMFQVGGGVSVTNISGGVISVLPYAVLTTNQLNVASLAIQATSTVRFSPQNVSNGCAIIGSLSAGGLLDIGSASADISNSSIGSITQAIAQGYNGGQWITSDNPSFYTGISSTSAGLDTTHLTAVGAIQNDQGGSAIYSASRAFEGAVPAASDVLIRYTYYGDANLDGKVDGSDYSRIDYAYLSKGNCTGWYNGDFNYEGVVNGSDYTLIDNAFNTQGAALSTEVATATSQLIESHSTRVPEPTTPGLAIGATALLSRQRIRRR